MHIIKYDKDYTRRNFMEKTAKGVAAAGVLAPLWEVIKRDGVIDKAYPEEAMSIEAYTNGQVKVGDKITADNVDLVKDLLDPIAYVQVKQFNRRINIVETTRNVADMYPLPYYEATLKNDGKGAFDANGNVINTDDGGVWLGGNPFPNPKTALEAFANITLAWGRHDETIYAIPVTSLDPDGNVAYQYDFVWAEMNNIGLTNFEGGHYWPGHEDKLRYQSTWFTKPADVKGTSFVNIWSYDQREFPDLFGYLPAFKRIRRFPTNQRFEPLVPGISLFLSDAWAAGDPMLTWGNYKIVGTQPFLGAMSQNWTGGTRDNWDKDHTLHGGPQDNMFYEVNMEFIPEALVIDAEPTGFPRAPVGKKRCWLDVRQMGFAAYVTYDRRGDIWKSFEPGYGLYKDYNGTAEIRDTTLDGRDYTRWMWTHVMTHDIQTNRMDNFPHGRTAAGGFKSDTNMGRDTYEKYMTQQAILRLGT